VSVRARARLEEQLQRLAAQLHEHNETIEAALSRHVAKRTNDVRRIGDLIDRQFRTVDMLKAEVIRLRASFRRQAAYMDKLTVLAPNQVTDRLNLLARLDRLAQSRHPIVVGPWTGEVGYEVLYWAPFVRWFVQQYGVDPARVRVISRGGPISWYGPDLAPGYADALSFFTPAEFRERSAARAWMKQDQVTAMDREILRRARASGNWTRASMLHPLLMFRAFKGFWGGRLPLNDILSLTSHERLTPPPPVTGLPGSYVAVRFYFRSSFPDTPANRSLVVRTLSALTSHTDVVVLNPGFRIDDHYDFAAERGERIHTIDHLLTPERNLDVQTAVIAGAEAFVGSYGGFSYLAPLLGVKSVAFYSEPTFKTSHLELAEHVFERVGGGSLTVANVADADLLASAVPQITTR
jgi:hypothetical protein